MNYYYIILRLIKRSIKKFLQLITLKKSKNEKRIIITTNNYKVTIPEDLIWAYSSGDYYEQNVIYFLDQIVKSYHDPIMLDIGANCGYYSVRYSNLCKQIFSFEPVSNTYKILKKNIKRNSICNVISLKIGLSDINEIRTINLYNSCGNNSLFERKVPIDHSLKKIGIETIELKNLDNLVQIGKIPIPNIIKIDVEGAELKVLKGAKKTISHYRPTILLEYSENTSNDAGYYNEVLLNILDLTEYNIYGIPENEKDFYLVKEADFNKYKIANLIFLPTELDTYFKHAAS